MSQATIRKPDANPVVAALLVLVLNLGHLVINGQQRKWLFILIAAIVGSICTCGILGLAIEIMSIIDAYQTAERLQKGEEIGEDEYSLPILFKLMHMIDKEATCSKA